jgi:Mrp family chromosome partitioning ATPase
VIYHLFVCHRSAGSEAAPALDELAGRSALEQLSEDPGSGYETLLIDMGPARVEEILPRLLDPSH